MSKQKFDKDTTAQAQDAIREEEKKKEEELKAQNLAKEEEEKKLAMRNLQAEQEAAEEQAQLVNKNDEEDKEVEQIGLHLLDIKPWKKDSEELLKDYKDKFPDRKLDEKGTLLFTSREELEQFLNDQAKLPPEGKGRKFLVSEVDAKGQLLGKHHFSCGDGKVYSGSPEEIIAKLKENQATANPTTQKLIADGLSIFERILNPKPQPTTDAKKRLEAMKSGDQPPAPTAEPKQEESEGDYKSPSPFNSTPNPFH